GLGIDGEEEEEKVARERIRRGMRRTVSDGDADADADADADWDWDRQVTAYFANHSPVMRGSFRNPPPGQLRSQAPEDPRLGLGQTVEDLLDPVARRNFRVVVIAPEEVERLDLTNYEKSDGNNDPHGNTTGWRSRQTSPTPQPPADDDRTETDISSSYRPRSNSPVQGDYSQGSNVPEPKPSVSEIRKTAEAAEEEDQDRQTTRRSSRARKNAKNGNGLQPPTGTLAPMESGQASKPKLTPACGSCRQSKVRCVHRSIMSEGETEDATGTVSSMKRKRDSGASFNISRDQGSVDRDSGSGSSFDEGSNELSSPLAKKALRRVRWKPEEGEEEEEEEEEKSSSLSASEGEREMPGSQGSVHEHHRRVQATGSAGNELRESPDSTGPFKHATSETSRRQPRRPSGKQRVKMETPDLDSGGQTNVQGSEERRFLPFPLDNLRGSAQLSVHSVFSQELQQRLEECESRWHAAIESLHVAKRALDDWVEAWQRGL
ncbi:hypothetical protein AOCH_004419, partial [Aspergillus ochraceoroseus]